MWFFLKWELYFTICRCLYHTRTGQDLQQNGFSVAVRSCWSNHITSRRIHSSTFLRLIRGRQEGWSSVKTKRTSVIGSRLVRIQNAHLQPANKTRNVRGGNRWEGKNNKGYAQNGCLRAVREWARSRGGSKRGESVLRWPPLQIRGGAWEVEESGVPFFICVARGERGHPPMCQESLLVKRDFATVQIYFRFHFFHSRMVP